MMEIILEKNTKIVGGINYKCENEQRSVGFEEFATVLLAQQEKKFDFDSLVER